ncbi:hypothetical protein Q3G72_007768 [Acer saccharum]|nr:hypothetical protein Q3G72_007768 [Acer saccharum]
MSLCLSSWLPLTVRDTQLKHNIIPTYSLQKSNNSNNSRINQQQVKCAVSTQISDNQATDQSRRSANYQPSIWSYDFLQSLQIRYADDKYRNRAEKLEEEVRCMINNEDAEMLTILELIDDIQRLGLGHRFHKDIKRALDRIVSWDNGHEFEVKAEEKLHVTALRFRLLRQHGYLVSQGENIMDEALTFCRTHLNEVKSMVNPALSELVNHALELPLHRRTVRLEARWYIEACSERKHVNGLLLELAKLDFNVVQSQLQSDLKDMSRWDLKAVDDLPDYMKLCFMALYNTVNEMAYDSLKQYGENVIPYITKAWGDLCKAFLQEAKWCYNKYTPTFEEYLENGWRSVSGTVFLVHSYFLLSQNITKEALESLDKQHNLMRYSSIIFRLCNDLATSTAELERGETASSILCYMRETGVSEEVAREHIRTLIDETWMKMNKDVVVDDGHPFAEPFVETAINLARIAHCTYQYGDGHGAPDGRAKQNVFSLLIEPISLMESQQL